MQLLIASILATTLFTGTLAQAGCTINTPVPPQQCGVALLEWQECASPVTLHVSNFETGERADGPFTIVAGTVFSWLVRVAEDTPVSLKLIDAHNNIAQSAIFTIQNGSTDCLEA